MDGIKRIKLEYLKKKIQNWAKSKTIGLSPKNWIVH